MKHKMEQDCTIIENTMNYQIWSEGYITNGLTGYAFFHGEIESDNFINACKIFFKDSKYYNVVKNTYFGCRLFDNKEDARKNFG